MAFLFGVVVGTVLGYVFREKIEAKVTAFGERLDKKIGGE